MPIYQYTNNRDYYHELYQGKAGLKNLALLIYIHYRFMPIR